MDKLDVYRQLIEQILGDYAAVPYAFGDYDKMVVFDRVHDRYLVMRVGWEKERRIHGGLLHLDVIDGKVWIQRDGTEDGVAIDLEEMGVPKQDIVLAFHEPGVRQYTGYAVA